MKLIYTTQNPEEAKQIHQCASVYTRHSLGWDNVVICTKKTGQLDVYLFERKEEALQERLAVESDSNIAIWYSIDPQKIEAFTNTLNNIRKVVRNVSLNRSKSALPGKDARANNFFSTLSADDTNKIDPALANQSLKKTPPGILSPSAQAAASTMNLLLMAANEGNMAAQQEIEKRYVKGGGMPSKKVAFVEEKKSAVTDYAIAPHEQSNIDEVVSLHANKDKHIVTNRYPKRGFQYYVKPRWHFQAANTPANSPADVIAAHSSLFQRKEPLKLSSRTASPSDTQMSSSLENTSTSIVSTNAGTHIAAKLDEKSSKQGENYLVPSCCVIT